jgi:predicted ATPase
MSSSPPDPTSAVPPGDVRAQLARILDSPSFLKAPILSRLLRYLVERTLDGETDQLKEYSLGVDVFDRGHSFDPRVDTIVRVQARRLRSRLADYYATDGQSDSVLIEIPTGRYTCTFHLRPIHTHPANVVSFTRHDAGHVARDDRGRDRLPLPRTPLIGREREVEKVRLLLLDRDVRLVTLTGAGGSGKTRLALQAASELTHEFSGGVFMLALAPLTDATGVVTALTQMLGLRHTAGRSMTDALREHVALTISAPTLLLLDNFEHVLAAGPVIAAVIESSAHVTALVTSRTVLRVYGEHEYPVPPLPVPAPRRSLQELEGNPAVRLFVQRAQAAQPGFAMTVENASTVGEICSRLDGLPLAIELAAAQVKIFPAEGILARLGNSLDFLSGGPRDLPARQQTLRNTIDWSHQLLPAAEQTLFRRLAVFVGGCTLEGAEAVCDAYRDLGIDVVSGMASLVDRSLVQRVGSIQGEPRFSMLETLREYALERLRASDDEARTRRAHAAYCMVLAEEGNAELGPEQRRRWLSRCDLDHDNFRAALDWLTINGNAEWALRIALALYGFWDRREHLLEGRQRLETIVNLEGSKAFADRWAHALSYLASLGGLHGDAETGQRLHQTALETFRALGNRKGEAQALNSLGSFLSFKGDYAGARKYYEQAVGVCRLIGSQPEIAAALSNLAGVVSHEGDAALARTLLEQARSIFQSLGDALAAAWAMNHLGDVARRQGDSAAARQLYERAVEEFTKAGDLWGIARSSADLAHVMCDEGDATSARQLFAEALVALERLDYKRGIARVLEGFAYLTQRLGECDRALTLAGAAAALRQAHGAVSRPVEEAVLQRSLEPAWNAYDPVTTRAIWSAGQKLTLDEAIAYALERPPSLTHRS